MPKQKKVAIIGNISSFDKCSITTALPIFAASGGIETYPLLTAIVASRDNDIDSPDYCDLTNNMPTVAEYWRSQQLKLDGLISGFLGSPGTSKCCFRYFNSFKAPKTHWHWWTQLWATTDKCMGQALPKWWMLCVIYVNMPILSFPISQRLV